MSVSVEFEMTVGSNALIVANAIVGRVTGLYIDEDSIKWALVKYADSTGAIHSEYFREGKEVNPAR